LYQYDHSVQQPQVYFSHDLDSAFWYIPTSLCCRSHHHFVLLHCRCYRHFVLLHLIPLEDLISASHVFWLISPPSHQFFHHLISSSTISSVSPLIFQSTTLRRCSVMIVPTIWQTY
jgi:hypothetical protein